MNFTSDLDSSKIIWVSNNYFWNTKATPDYLKNLWDQFSDTVNRDTYGSEQSLCKNIYLLMCLESSRPQISTNEVLGFFIGNQYFSEYLSILFPSFFLMFSNYLHFQPT